MHDSESGALEFTIVSKNKIFVVLFPTDTIALAAAGCDGNFQEFPQLLFITKIINVGGSTSLCPHCIFLSEVVERSEPRIYRWNDIL